VRFVHHLQAKWAWRRCRTTLADWAPDLLARLPPGANDEGIAIAEAALGCALPPIVVALYLIHDGLGVPATINNVRQDAPLLSLSDALEQHRFMCDMLADATLCVPEIRPSPGVRTSWWRRGWLPIETFGNGDLLFLDMDPAPSGRAGQIVEWGHEESSFPVRHSSLVEYIDSLEGTWLAELADRLDAR
jgi:cell wall assembly regulator SMI1